MLGYINLKDSALIIYLFEQHGIPVFCPALTDGSLGDMLYFHSFKNPGLILDIIQGVFE
jgi:deoxyhypusine synthase